MSAVPAHEAAATFDCKTPNCDGEARQNRGKFAYLCDACKARKIGRRAPMPAETAARAVAAHTVAVGIVPAARAIVPVAAELEKTLSRRRQATAEAKEALATFNQRLNDLKAAAEAALNGSSAP